MAYQTIIKFYKRELPILEKYENYFITAIKYNYMRNLTDTQVSEILPIYERALGKKYNLCKACSSSKLKFMQEVGKHYFAQIKKEI